MKNITKIIISAFLIILLANSSLGFAGMGGKANNMTIPQGNGNVSQIDLNNTTESDQDIIMVQHLIEVDANRLKAENKLFIRETLTFRNIGTQNFFGNLRTSLPDGSENISLVRSEMSEMMTGGGMPISFSQNQNIISWKDYVEQNSRLPFLYALEYSVKQNADANTEIFSKKLAIPALINYEYKEKPGLPAIIVKITKPQGSEVKFIDENGNKIAATEVDDKGEIFKFSLPQFKEIKIEISQASVPGTQNYTLIIVIVIGILIILVFSYPYIKNKLKPEEKVSSISKKNIGKTTKKANEEPSEIDTFVPSGKFKGKNAQQLGDLKEQILSKIKDLDKKYESGDLLDEEYEDTRNSYQDNLKEIEKMLKKMG
ncbi:MAG: hypothetical protein C3F06_10530 [Candidatus Methanoperedenaceae archaeon]|nr:MAG: hypothetical protein C3F06_10530 [Candidatus Methanoperedenaceae archaeon]